MEKSGYLNKEITTRQYPWLKKNFKKGKIVYEFTGDTSETNFGESLIAVSIYKAICLAKILVINFKCSPFDF